MAISTFDQIHDQIKQKKPASIYLLHGTETYFTEELIELFQHHLLDESESAFNLDVLYGGKDLSVNTIIDALSQYPMGSDFRLVLVRNAQDVKNIDALIDYAESPYDTSILVLAYEGVAADGRKKLTTLIKNKHVVFESKPLYDNNMPQWITELAKKNGKTISTENATMIAEFLGTDLRKVANEINKTVIAIGDAKEITKEHIENFIGINRNFNNFELQDAMLMGDNYKAQMIAQILGDKTNKQPIVLLIGNLYTTFIKVMLLHVKQAKSDAQFTEILKTKSFTSIKVYREALKHYSPADVVRIFDILKEFDQKSKGVNTSDIKDSELIKELVYKIMHVRSLPATVFNYKG